MGNIHPWWSMVQSLCYTVEFRRDPRQTSHDGELLLMHLRNEDLPVNLASLNYRLSPSILHPGHQEDVIAALRHLRDQYGMEQYILVGHSAGACLAFQTGYVVPGCQGIVGVEGIYDLEHLVDEYPDYRGFVEEAFGKKIDVWRQASPSTIVTVHYNDPSLKCRLVQSKEDQLLSPKPTERMISILQSTGVDGRDIAWIKGNHNSTITTPDFFEVVRMLVVEILNEKE
jgi:kynurenine formamidase